MAFGRCSSSPGTAGSLDIVDMERWASQASARAALAGARVPRPTPPHARATLTGGHVAWCSARSARSRYSPAGSRLFAFRNADWHLLDLHGEVSDVGGGGRFGTLARRLFQTALDLSDDRAGALFVVLRRPLETLSELVAPEDRLDMEPVGAHRESTRRRGATCCTCWRDAPSPISMRRCWRRWPHSTARWSATVMGSCWRRARSCAIPRGQRRRRRREGARTTAAMAASRFGPVLKVSEDGLITLFRRRPRLGYLRCRFRCPIPSPDRRLTGIYVGLGDPSMRLVRGGHQVTAIARDPEKAARIESRRSRPRCRRLGRPAPLHGRPRSTPMS